MTLPNQLTVLRMVLTPVTVFLLLMQDPFAVLLATVVFLIAAITDWYDGHFARKYGYVTAWGKFLDPLADKILINSVLLCFVLLEYIPLSLVLIIGIRDMVLTALRGYMMVYDKPIASNFFGKIKTVTQIVLVYLILIYRNIEQFASQATLDQTLGFVPNVILRLTQFVAIITVLSGLVYLYGNRKPIIELLVKVGKFAFSPVSLLLDSIPNEDNTGNSVNPLDKSSSGGKTSDSRGKSFSGKNHNGI